MELTAFRQQADAIKTEISPYKIVRLDELKQVEGAVYSVDDFDLRLTPRAQHSLDSAIGTTAKQMKTVKECSGDFGQANFRNYLSVATNMSNEKQVVLVADKENRIVTDVIVPKEEFIPAEAFLDFTEMFVDATHSEVEKIERSLYGNMEIQVYLYPSKQLVVSLGTDEDFLSNGMYLRWDGRSIELGNYFTRLVCSNGMTQRSEIKESAIYSMEQSSVQKILGLATSEEIMSTGFQRFKRKAINAMSTAVSLRELGVAYTQLVSPRIGLPGQVVETIIPYQECLKHFEERGISVSGREKIVKTDFTWWKLYNILTAYATHTTNLAPDDNTRGHIATMAMSWLGAKHDIDNYIEYE